MADIVSVFSDDFDRASLGTDWTAVETHGTVAIVDNKLEINWLNAGDPDTVAYCQNTHAALTTAPTYRRYRFEVTVDAAFTLPDTKILTLIFIEAADGTDCALVRFQNAGGNYRLSLFDYGNSQTENTETGTFALGSTYYFELRVYPDASSGGFDFLVYSDSSYSTEVSALRLTYFGGISQSRLPAKLTLGELASATRDISGAIRFDSLSIADVYEFRDASLNFIQLLGVNW